MKNAIKIKKNALTLNNAKVNGTDIETKMIKDIASLVSKKKMKNWKKLKWTKTEIILMITKLKVAQKI